MMVLRSVRVRLTLWYVLLLAVILAGFSAGVYLILRHNLYDNLDGSLANRADTFLGVVAYEEGRPTLVATGATGDPDAESFVRLFDASGDVTFDGSAAGGVASIDSRAVERALGGESVTGTAALG